MSFVRIPSQASASVRLRVTKLPNGPFRFSDHVSVRPSPKPAAVATVSDGTVDATFTAGNFDGEQFILWWNRGTDGGGVEGLAFFLDPPYPEPAGSNVLKVTSWDGLESASLNGIDTLDFEGMVLLGSTGDVAYPVPDRINSIFLGPNAWVQDKLIFTAKSATRRIYGPGVLDGSQFSYRKRNCLTGSMNIELTNVLIKHPSGLILPLTSFDGQSLGKVSTNGADVNVKYGLGAL